LARHQETQPQVKSKAPSAPDQLKARAVIKTIFKDGYAEAEKSDQAKRTLALKVFTESKATREDPQLRFGGFLEARDLAAAGGDLRLAFNTIDELDKLYIIDAAGMRLETLHS